MNKIDFKKQYKQFYSASAKEIKEVDVPELNFLMIDGKGDPAVSPLFPAAVQALYTLSYTIKFSLMKKDPAIDYAVPPLQGLWWMGNVDHFDADKRDEWEWTLMIAQPDIVNTDAVDAGKSEVLKKKKMDTSAVRFESYKEGISLQLMHIGPYAEEAPNIRKIHDYMLLRGYQFNGKHHEIYLSDPRKTSPGKLKTILRQPVKK